MPIAAARLTRAPDVALARDLGVALTHDHADTYWRLHGPGAVPAAISAVSAAVTTSACAIHAF